MAKKRSLLFTILAVTACSTRRVALGLSSRKSSRSHPTTAAAPPQTVAVETAHNDETREQAPTTSLVSRKQALSSLAMLGGLVAATTTTTNPARAFDASFPDELTDSDDTKEVGVLIGKRSNAQQRKQQAVESKKQLDQNLVTFNVKKDVLPSLTWGLALFFGSGSRSNPLSTPLANALYDPKQEKWLQERNLGLFSAPPIEFLALQLVIFLLLGGIVEFGLLQLSDGDSGVCSQLAGVALINAGFFEIGRIASGEKGLTRDENDRAVQLEDEFNEFAEKRLKQGGNCHRSDVTKSFRRYFAKYRQADSEQYPLTDLEIEKLLKRWNKTINQNQAEMRSTGFYYGIQINTDADVFG